MFVLRKTMDAALEAERDKANAARADFYGQYGDALYRVTALQKQLEAWITGKTEDGVTPEQMAQMFWAQDDRWQAAFFNALSPAAQAYWDALPPVRANEYRGYLGVPAGEGQWWHLAQHLDDSGFATLEAMFDHAKAQRERIAA